MVQKYVNDYYYELLLPEFLFITRNLILANILNMVIKGEREAHAMDETVRKSQLLMKIMNSDNDTTLSGFWVNWFKNENFKIVRLWFKDLKLDISIDLNNYAFRSFRTYHPDAIGKIGLISHTSINQFGMTIAHHVAQSGRMMEKKILTMSTRINLKMKIEFFK